MRFMGWFLASEDSYFKYFLVERNHQGLKISFLAFYVIFYSFYFFYEITPNSDVRPLIKDLLLLYLLLNCLSKLHLLSVLFILCWVWLFNFFYGSGRLWITFFKQCFDVYYGRILWVYLGLNVFEWARRPTLLTRRGAIHVS